MAKIRVTRELNHYAVYADDTRIGVAFKSGSQWTAYFARDLAHRPDGKAHYSYSRTRRDAVSWLTDFASHVL